MNTAIASIRAPLVDLHARFHDVLPVVQTEGMTAFRTLPSVEDREDAMAEAALSAWTRFLRAVTESVAIDPSDLARRAVASVARRLHRRAMLAA